MTEIFSHPIPAVIVLLGVLVFVHEFGHFIVGRWCGIGVETFSIGFGPRMFGFEWRGVEYRIGWIPLGGFVKFAGSHPSEDVPDHVDGIGFLQATRKKRALAIAAGPFANFLLAGVIFMILIMNGIPHPPATIGKVIEDSPAWEAGVRYKDKVVEIDGHTIEYWTDLQKVIKKSPGKTIPFVVERSGERVALQITPEKVKAKDIFGREKFIGRAGVALGRLPSIITVQADGKLGASAGLQTGDRTVGAELAGKSFDLSYYPDIRGLFAEIGEEAEQVLKLKVVKAGLPGQPAQEDRPREVEIVLPAGINESNFEDHLGISDSNLTVGEARENLKGILKAGDVFQKWGDKKIENIYHLQELLGENKEPKVPVTIMRNFKSIDISLMLHPVEAQKPEGKVTIYTLPIVFWGEPEDPPPIIQQDLNPLSAAMFGFKETVRQSGELVATLGMLITGQFPLKALGGPMLIAAVAGNSAKRGWEAFISAMALISINLGVINLFPIPVLDGGQLILIGSEAMKGRPLREKAIENFQKIGFAMILALVVLATYNDLSRFWKSMLESVVGMF